MNLLAHAYLSRDHHEITVGNFLGDFIKGKAYLKFDSKIQKGVLLHRKIDTFTDQHSVVLESKKILRPEYHHYAPVIVDVFYDHFLATNWQDYHDQTLLNFTENFYRLLNQRKHLMPKNAAQMLYYMEKDNWLYHYQFLDGINRTLHGMSRRTSHRNQMSRAVEALSEHYEVFGAHFKTFFPDLIEICDKFLEAEGK